MQNQCLSTDLREVIHTVQTIVMVKKGCKCQLEMINKTAVNTVKYKHKEERTRDSDSQIPALGSS